MPWSFIFDHGVEDGQEFANAGDLDNFVRFATLVKPGGEGFDGGVTAAS